MATKNRQTTFYAHEDVQQILEKLPPGTKVSAYVNECIRFYRQHVYDGPRQPTLREIADLLCKRGGELDDHERIALGQVLQEAIEDWAQQHTRTATARAD